MPSNFRLVGPPFRLRPLPTLRQNPTGSRYSGAKPSFRADSIHIFVGTSLSPPGYGIRVIPCAFPLRCTEERRLRRNPKRGIGFEEAQLFDHPFYCDERVDLPVQQRAVGWSPPLRVHMLEELEAAAKDLNVSRQAVIKTMLRQALDQRHHARTPRSRIKRS